MNSTQPEPLRQLDRATCVFRDRLAREHRDRWTEEHRRARLALDGWDPLLPAGTRAVDELTGELHESTDLVTEEMQDALSVARWHIGRDNGQKYRFRKLSLCGSRMVVAMCKACESERKPIAEGCGIARLCERCSLLSAKRRRARFGRARERATSLLKLIGYTRAKGRRDGRRVPGGVWSDKMLTLTVPHFLLCHVAADAQIRDFGKGRTLDPTMARIYAVRAAWPLFSRALGRWFKRGGTLAKPKKYDVKRDPIAFSLKDGTIVPPPMHRAFEWTPGSDGLGHPHFHVWMIAPYIPGALLSQLWRDALIAVGVPLERDSYVRVQIQRFEHFDRAAVGELIKSGKAESLAASRLYRRQPNRKRGGTAFGPANAFEYADGWTIAEALRDASPDVVASLYMALEGSRLTQGSRGFFEADDPPSCETCQAQGCWHVRFEPVVRPLEYATDASDPVEHERGPPP